MNVAMRFLVVPLLLVCCHAESSRSLFAQDENIEALEEQAFKQAAALVGPSLVRIQTVGGLDRVGRILTGTGPTTGVAVSKDGYVISSAFNFISKPASILVQLPDGRRLTAKVVATDRLKMLTLLKIAANDLIPASAAKKDSIRVGQWAIALGQTFDSQRPSLSIGIVSALKRIWGKAIQTDAKISPVNYGGPLVDIHGKVMGILAPLSPRGRSETAGVEWYDSGIGFAIPMEDVYASLDRLKTGKDLNPGLMGISFKGRGLLAGKPEIDRVRATSPADEAGLKAGDVITAVDGQAVRRQAEVKQVLGSRYAGDEIVVTVQRNAETIQKKVTLVAKLLAYESGYLGILPIRETGSEVVAVGVGVRHVFSGSPAETAGFKSRDRILRFNDQEVADAKSLLDLVSRLRPKEKATIVYRRGDEEITKEIQLAAVPNSIPAELRSTAIPLPPASDEEAETDDSEEDKAETAAAKLGRFTVEMPAHHHSYWAYVPEGYNPDFQYSLMVWIHPDGDTMEATIFKQWKPICDRRGIMIIAPKAEKISGWSLNEAEFIHDAVADFKEKYTIDDSRVFLHGYSQGGTFAYYVAFKYRETFRGVANAASPLSVRPPENSPDNRLQFYLVCGDKDNLYRRVQRTVNGLRNVKFPTAFTTLKGRDHRYPSEEDVREIGRWADCLDRI